MTSTPEFLKTASEICNRIYEISPGAIDLEPESRDWFDQVSSRIALITAGAKINYLDHNLPLETKEPTFIAITDDLVVIVKVDLITYPAVVTSAEVVDRRSIRGLSVGRISNAIGYQGDEWPKKISVTIQLGDERIPLPYRSSDATRALELAALVPSLARDVNGARA